jgi:hypothetical protein
LKLLTKYYGSYSRRDLVSFIEYSVSAFINTFRTPYSYAASVEGCTIAGGYSKPFMSSDDAGASFQCKATSSFSKNDA